MTRTTALSLVVAVLIAGTAFGQAPLEPRAPSAGGTILSDGSSWPGLAPAPCAVPPDPERFWASADYLLGWVRRDELPALVTTSPPGTPRAAAGVLGPNTTTVLFGASAANTAPRSGVRSDQGYWFDADRDVGIEGGLFFLAGGSTSFSATSDGTRILARPFIDATTVQPASALIAFPGLSAGSVHASESAGLFSGGNLDLRANAYRTSCFRCDALLGYQYLRYDEHLSVQQSVQPTGGAFPAGTNILSSDSFGARNIFNGVDVGLRSEFCYGPLSVEVLTKVAAGSLNRTVNIAGSQTVLVPGTAPVTNAGGLLALSSNIGAFAHHTWSGVPEGGVKFSWRLTPNILLHAGYSFLWWPNAARASDQIDPIINPNLIPPANAAPGAPFRPIPAGVVNNGLWAQMATFGLEVRY